MGKMVWNRRADRKGISVLLLVLSLIFLVGSGGCGDSDPDQTAQSGQGPGAGNHGQGRPQGQRPAQPAIPVAVTRVVSGSISSYYRATATLEAEKEAQILARVTGVVETILVEEGDYAAAGDPLLKVDNDEYRFRLEQAVTSTLSRPVQRSSRSNTPPWISICPSLHYFMVAGCEGVGFHCYAKSTLIIVFKGHYCVGERQDNLRHMHGGG